MRSIFLKVARELLPQVKDKYPFIFLEHGRLEVDDSSVKWIDEKCHVISIPCATVNTILLGPGTSVTHAAIKSISESNCTVCWVGSDSLLYYATGETPTADTYNLKIVFKSKEKIGNSKKVVQLSISRSRFTK